MKVFSEKKYLENMQIIFGYNEEDLEEKGWTWYKGLDKKPIDSLPYYILDNWSEEET